jgi:hypothetical protein
MKRALWTPAECKVCGARAADGIYISTRALCLRCASEREAMNRAQLQMGYGPYTRWWAARLADSLGFGPLDGMPPKP